MRHERKGRELTRWSKDLLLLTGLSLWVSVITILQILPFPTSNNLQTQNNGRPTQTLSILVTNSAGHVSLRYAIWL
jgi:hypothetical protein